MTYIGAVGRRIRLGDEPLGCFSTSSGWGHFEPAPCSWAEGLTSLTSQGAAVEPPPSIGALDVVAGPLTPVVSWGAAVEPPPSFGTSGMAVDPSAPVDS